MVCKHKWIFDGVHKPFLKEGKDRIIVFTKYDENTKDYKTGEIKIGKEFYPNKLLFHCEKCCKLKWKELEE